MGKQNKQRRAAKRRKQRRGRNRPGGAGQQRTPRGSAPPSRADAPSHAGAAPPTDDRHAAAPPPTTEPPRADLPPVDALLRAAADTWGSDAAMHVRCLLALAACADAAVPELEGLLRRSLPPLWQRGWTPADVVHVTARELGTSHADLAAAVVVADGRERQRRGEPLHPRWTAQLEALAERATARFTGDQLRPGVELLGLLSRLPAVHATVPPPGAGAATAAATVGLDARLLARVRALLAKAETTEYDAEAEALSAKAQELIARHAIDEALVHADADVGVPSIRRIPVEDPYASEKAIVLAEVAEANRCRTVHSPAFGWVTAFGYEGDLDAVELLAASLLAQATGAMARHGSVRDAVGRSRTRSFRRSFLLGFACRIGERLRAATDGQVAATDDDRLLPVLSARTERVEAAVADAFPELVHKQTGASHHLGFAAGQAAADLAELDVSAGALRAADGV